MTPISDGVVIGIVLGLVFAAVSYYLYSRVTQLERKVGLMENILLDLKVTTEQTLLSSTEGNEKHDDENHESSSETRAAEVEMPTYRQMSSNISEENDTTRVQDNSETREVSVDQNVPRVRTPSAIQVEKEKTSVSTNYEAMTYKELVTIARQKGISGLRNMSKAQVIEALRGSPNGSSNFGWSMGDNDGKSVENLGSAMDSINQGEVIASLELEPEPEASLVSSE
jgi:hypothetical protein